MSAPNPGSDVTCPNKYGNTRRDRAHPASAPPETQIDRTVWTTIAALQRPGQPNLLHKIIGLYLTSSQAQVDEIRHALQEGNPHAMIVPAHTLKPSSAMLGATSLAGLANELEQACRTNRVEQTERLISLIEEEYRNACVIFRQELISSSKEAA